MSLQRRSFISGIVAAATVRTVPARAVGARSGDWCRPLTRYARSHDYDFSLELLDGGVFTLSEMAGKPVWLNFFTTWCGPCNREASDVVRIARKYGDAVHVVAVDVGERPAAARGFRAKHDFALPIALDATSSVFDALGFGGYPTHVFLNADQSISCVSIGDLTPEQMDNELAVAVARTPVALPQAAASPGPTSR